MENDNSITVSSQRDGVAYVRKQHNKFEEGENGFDLPKSDGRILVGADRSLEG